MTTTVLNTKITEVEKKIPNYDCKNYWSWEKISNYDKHLTTPEFNKLTVENFTLRLKQADLVNKTDVNSKLTSFKRKLLQVKLNI